MRTNGNTTTIKRMPVRFRDGDCPEGVLDIFDNPEFADRYSVFYSDMVNDRIGFRGMSSNPCHPQGIGMYDDMPVHQFRAYRERSRRKRITFSQLPEAVQKCVIDDCKPGAE